jgi:hypothetical protein
MTDSLSMVPFHVRQAMRIHPARLLASLSAVVLLVGCYDLTLNPYMGGDGGQDEAGSFDAIDAQASMGGSTGAGGTGDTTGTGGDTGGGAAGGGGVGGAISSGGGGDAGVPALEQLSSVSQRGPRRSRQAATVRSVGLPPGQP